MEEYVRRKAQGETPLLCLLLFTVLCLRFIRVNNLLVTRLSACTASLNRLKTAWVLAYMLLMVHGSRTCKHL